MGAVKYAASGKEGESKKVCPLFALNQSVGCFGEQCGFWDASGGCCSVAVISACLRSISDGLPYTGHDRDV